MVMTVVVIIIIMLTVMWLLLVTVIIATTAFGRVRCEAWRADASHSSHDCEVYNQIAIYIIVPRTVEQQEGFDHEGVCTSDSSEEDTPQRLVAQISARSIYD
jgi:biopolymer transport protein ExbB/TolQ